MQDILTVAISTTNLRIRNLTHEIIKPHNGIVYLIVVQSSNGDFECARTWINANLNLVDRCDVKFIFERSMGVAKSRNICIENSTSKFLWFCDDDLEVKHEVLDDLLVIWNKHPECAAVCVGSLNNIGNPRKRFLKKVQTLNRFNSAKYATFEISVNLSWLRRSMVKFDTKFGAGATYWIGDEYIFLADIMDVGGKVLYSPLYPSVHCDASSGFRQPGIVEYFNLKRAVFVRVFGPLGIFIAAYYTVRHALWANY